jgi:hypothetical protein
MCEASVGIYESAQSGCEPALQDDNVYANLLF